jgi:Tfp pilus assembly protein PilN
MLNINFVPDDYVQNSESRRTNVIYLVLLLVTMTALGASFTAIRMRYRSVTAKELLVNMKMSQIQESIQQFEELQMKRKAMIQTALMTAELLEPVPRSVLLASLTNNLPEGASLLRIKLLQKEPPKASAPKASGPAAGASKSKTAASNDGESPEKRLETLVDIEGIAASDLQVAVYIEKLTASTLFDNVALVESKEYKGKAGAGSADTQLRQFKLTAMLKKNVQITKEDIRKIACDTVAIQ